MLWTSEINVAHGRGVLCDAHVVARTPVILAMGEVVIARGMTEREALMSYQIPGYDLLALCFDIDARCNIVKYVNSAHGQAVGPNVKIMWYDHLPILKSTKAIVPGTELLSTYGVA